MRTLRLIVDGDMVWFGPFVGYHLRPEDPQNLSRLLFSCYNEDQFYTKDLPAGEKLFKGQAQLVLLPDVGKELPQGAERIQPVYPKDIPPEWLATRPEPKDEFRHFHSCYDRSGPVRHGFWLRHEAVTVFTYDMGGRVGADSILHHHVSKGVDTEFALLMEFDRGPIQ